MAALSTDAGSEIGLNVLPPSITSTKISPVTPERSEAAAPKKIISSSRAISKDMILEAMEQFGGNREAMSNHFGVSRMTLWRKIKQFELED